ncbi:MAG: hypothetical protein QGH76_05110 [Phycisphaerales bacterium]|nr:hypothetical protein [Phycisphaerales bacterium]
MRRVVVSLCVVGLAATSLHAGLSDFTAAATRQLREATRSARNGSNLPNLRSLRNLRDPALRPYFFQLAQHSDWAVQVHAVLGLGELEDNEQLDPWLIQQVSPIARNLLVSHALDDKKLTLEQMRGLLAWPLLEPGSRLLLAAELHEHAEPIDPDILQSLATNPDLTIATFASLMIDGDDGYALTEATDRLRRASGAERAQTHSSTLVLIRQHRPDGAVEWLLQLLSDDTMRLTSEERYWTIYALVDVDADKGFPYWESAVPAAPTREEQIRWALLLMEAGAPMGEAVAERLQITDDEPLLAAMLVAGDAASRKGDDVVEAMAVLVETEHAASIDWAFRAADRLTDEQKIALFTRLATLPEGGRVTPRRGHVATQAVSRLLEIDPEAVYAMLREAEDDSMQQVVLLLELLQSGGDRASVEAEKIRRIGFDRPDALALLLAARGSGAMSDADRRKLGIIAGGGGRVDEPLQTQAAWLYLQRMGMTEKALAAVSGE